MRAAWSLTAGSFTGVRRPRGTTGRTCAIGQHFGNSFQRVPIAQVNQFLLANLPVDLGALELRIGSRRADAMLVETDARPLVGDGAFLAELHLGRKIVLLDQISLHLRDFPSSIIDDNFHEPALPCTSVWPVRWRRIASASRKSS